MSSVPPPPPSSSPPPPPFGDQPPAPPLGAPPPAPAPAPAPAPPTWTPSPATGAPPAAPPAYEAPGGKPPRPKVQIGAILTMVGGLLVLVGAFLPWLKVSGGGDSETLTGMDDFVVLSDGELKILEGPGQLWIFSGVVLIGLGLALYLAGRVLAVAIIAIIMATLGLFFVLGGWGAASDSKDFAEEGSYQFGLILGTLGGFAALAGSIAATAKRRR